MGGDPDPASGPQVFWESVYLRHRDAVHAYAWTLDRALAEDAAAEAFARCLNRLRAGGAPPDLLGFLLLTARNYIIDRKRSEKRHALKRADLPRSGTADPEPWRRVVRDEETGLLQAAVEALPPPLREIVVLHAWSGRTFEWIARATGTPLGTVLGRYQDALRRLRRALKEKAHE